MVDYVDEDGRPKSKRVYNGYIKYTFPGLPDTGYGPGVRVIENTNNMTVAESYTQLQGFMDEWAGVTNKGGGIMSAYNDD